MIRLQDASNNWKGPWIYTDEKGYMFLSKSRLYPKDIIMSNVGSVGKFFKVPNLDRPMTLAPNAVLLRTMNENKFFVYYLLNSSYTQKLIQRKVTPGVQSKINKTDFKNINLLVSNTQEEQKNIGLLFDSLDNTITLYHRINISVHICQLDVY